MKTPKLFFSSLLLLAIAFSPGGSLRANPADGVVTFGAADFIGGDGRLTIRQGSEMAIINWGDFSIRRGEITEFIQPGRSSAVLNRVVSGNPSEIQGSLRANGSVFLINPNGILVGPSGTIDVGGSAVLSTLDISDDDFLDGGDMLFTGNSDAGVVNMGRINAIEGDVFLFGRTVSNQGTITAPNGTVGLGAGTEILLTANPDSNGERVFVRAGNGLRADVGVENTGTIEAAAAELKAHGNMYALAINNSGTIRATGANRRGGQVFLRSPGGRISNTGTIEATVPGSQGGRILVEAGEFDMGGTLATDPEGNIDLLVDRVNLLPGATIGNQQLHELIVDASDPNGKLTKMSIERESAEHVAGRGPDGRIIRGGRFGSDPQKVVATRRNGRVMIGMPGVSRIEPGITPRAAAMAVPPAETVDTPGETTTRPSTIVPTERPVMPSETAPAEPGTMPPIPPVTPPTPPIPAGSGQPRP